MLAWQTYNALFVIRAVTKYLIETVPEYQLSQHLDVQADKRNVNRPNGPIDIKPEGDTSSEDAVEATEQLAVSSGPSPENTDTNPEQPDVQETRQAETQTSPKLTINESRVEMLIDALVGLIIDVPVTTLFQGRYSMHAPLLVKTLVNNFSSMYTAPEHMFGYSNSSDSLVLGLASGLWSMLTFSSSANKKQSIYTHPPIERKDLSERLTKEHPVANQSCLLLLAFTNHCMHHDNLYRKALFSCEDAIELVATTPQRDSNAGVQVSPPRIDMAALHKALCATAGCEHSTLLLYLMLHSCKAYKRHVCAVPNIEQLILPMLQCLYRAPDSNSHHIYMSLIVLLILTEDDNLIKTVHHVTLKNLVWYTERSISEISLGGLMILVIIRTIQYNILRVRDKYLHTNCLAALANMSKSERQINGIDLAHHSDDKWEHICVLDEVLRMLLEILNSCLSNQLQSNTNLLYALLHKKAVFAQYRAEPQFHHIIQNIEMVIGYFSTRLQRVQEGAGADLGVTEVLNCIKKGTEQWSSDRLKKFPELKFRYVEEERPEEFFTPYVWSLVSTCGVIYWASEGGTRAINDIAV
ncbi:Dymeclin [Eumeta japonica]|uniref:Dymeclin n=1 Tax=Eumeta variegata TaxID=151549 RepID=A0A4C1TN23_EUMVA|nr:Dymeclin [Eumeta japonica]